MTSPALTESMLTKRETITDGPQAPQSRWNPAQSWTKPLESASIASSGNIKLLIFNTEPALTHLVPALEEDLTWFGMHVSREPIDPSFFDEDFDEVFDKVWAGPRWQFKRELEEDYGG